MIGGNTRVHLYADAARNMRRRQLVHRLRRGLPPRALAAGLSRQPPPGWRPLARGIGVEVAPSSGPQPPPHRDQVFRAVGASRHHTDPGFWTDPADGLLFLFHLHGFTELALYATGDGTAEGDRFWERCLEGWLDAFGEPVMPQWHPFPMSGRVLSWCAALSRDGWLTPVRERMLASLWMQVRVLARSIEHDIGGNHVIHNGVALAVGGTCLESPRIQERGLALLEVELAAQMLPDGGHEERSPSYQRFLLGDLTDCTEVLRRAGHAPPTWLTRAIDRMTAWLEALAGPDGAVPPLNDGWDGPPIDVPVDRAPIEDLAQSGYIALRERTTQAVLDVGPLAPAHLPAHAHADALSFVLWAQDEPLIVDPGSGAYSGADRDRFRGTAAHNTVEVDGLDQCELWGTFRAAFMPHVERGAVRHQDGAAIVRACHDGYTRLPDPVVHSRLFIWLGEDGLLVADRLLGRGCHTARSRLSFAEGLGDPRRDDLPGGLTVRPLGATGPVQLHSATRAPYLGSRVTIPTLETSHRAQPGEPFGWAITRAGIEVALGDEGVTVDRPGRSPLTVRLDQ